MACVSVGNKDFIIIFIFFGSQRLNEPRRRWHSIPPAQKGGFCQRDFRDKGEILVVGCLCVCLFAKRAENKIPSIGSIQQFFSLHVSASCHAADNRHRLETATNIAKIARSRVCNPFRSLNQLFWVLLILWALSFYTCINSEPYIALCGIVTFFAAKPSKVDWVIHAKFRA